MNTQESVSGDFSNPWHKRESIGLVKAAIGTIRNVLLNPGGFFESLEIKDSVKEPFFFYFLISVCVGMITIATEAFFKGYNLLFFVFASAIIIALTSAILFVGSAILHLGVILLGGTGGFRGTFNVLAYNASSSIFSVIPYIGGIISAIWGIVVGVKGFKRVHNLSTIKAVLAYFGVFFIVAIIALLAAIAIPNLLRARVSANDAAAKARVKSIATAIETYAIANNGQYPLAEYDLVYGAKPAYLPQAYDKKTIGGYAYSLELSGSSYEVFASPENCGVTGTLILKGKKGGILEESPCSR